MRRLRLVKMEPEPSPRFRIPLWLGVAALAALALAAGMGESQAITASRDAGPRPTASHGGNRGSAAPAAAPGRTKPLPSAAEFVQQDPVLLGRSLVINHDCGGCHGGFDNPAAEGWLQGVRTPEQIFKIGPCAVTPGATPCFRTYPRNLTPDNATGLGRFSERQIFNALRYGLRPGETPDVEITSNVPGQGNFPQNPKYLAPPMPWPAFRHLSDAQLWAIAAYLKRGLKPASNRVQDSEGPPDFWASAYTLDKIGPYPSPPFPTSQETRPEQTP